MHKQTLFRRILEHRALDDGKTGTTVRVRSFDFSEILETTPQQKNSAHTSKPLTQLQTAQKLYHGVVNDFIPVSVRKPPFFLRKKTTKM